MATASSDIRADLKELGKRRKALDKDTLKLSNDVERALKRAQGEVSVTEAAKLLGMHRTTVYRVYAPHLHAA